MPSVAGLPPLHRGGLVMWLALLACQDPFPVDRHDLVGFRIAAIEVEPIDLDDPSGPLRPRLAAVVDGRPYADEQPLLNWFWLTSVDELEGLDALGEPDAVGPAPELFRPDGAEVLALLARHGSEEQRSFVRLDDDDLAPESAAIRPNAIRARPVELSIDELSEESLAVDARGALVPGAETSIVPSGTAARLEAIGVPATGRVRWMATAGTFLELDGATTDWFASDLTLDGGDVEERSDLADGPVTFVALSTGEARSRFAATDRVVTPGPLLAHTFVNGRMLFGLDLDAPAMVTLARDDLAPSGLSMRRFVAVTPEPATLEALDLVDAGTEGLACFEPVGGPFDPNWLLSLRCPRSVFDGAEVLVVPDRWRDRFEEAP